MDKKPVDITVGIMDKASARQMINILGKKFPRGFEFDIAKEHCGKNFELNVFMETCNQMVKEQVLALRKSTQGKPIFILLGKQSAGARNLSPEEQTVYNMIRETKGMGKLMYHLNQETKIKAPSINAKLKKVVESLINKKLVKKIHSIKYGKKILYIDTQVEPDESHFGGAWYDDNQEFDSELVKVVKNMAFRKLKEQKLEADQKYKHDPLKQHKCSMVTAEDVIKYCKEMKVFHNLPAVKSMEEILNTFCQTGEAEYKEHRSSYGDVWREYWLVGSFIDEEHGSVITQTPCGLCSLSDQCGVGNLISPLNCEYMKNTLDNLDYLDW